MVRNRIVLMGLLLLIVIGVVGLAKHFIPVLSDFFGEKTQIVKTENERDKKTCGACHSDKNNDFKRKYQHPPFANWMCTDCHKEHELGAGKYEYVVDIDKLCSSCHYDRKGEMQMSIKHAPYGKGHCTDCHDPHASDNPKLLVLPESQLCIGCHNVSMKYNFSVKHPPYEKGYCTDCHSPHASNYRGMTVLEGEKLCLSCHYEIANDLNQRVTHKPVKEGKCVDCHGPHATPNDNLLLLSKQKLCFSCHTDKVAESKVGYQHEPFVTGNCADCHTPHGGAYDWLLLREKSELCYMCHDEFRKIFTGPSYHPVGNGLLECYGCHDPHSGPGEKITRAKGNELCYTCHKGLEESYEKLAHATKAEGDAGKGSCLNCHEAHASQTKPLLEAPQEQLCGSCHGKVVKAAINHPVGDKYQDPWRGGTMKCSSCHGPHGTENEYFTLLPNTALCLKCHGKELKTDPGKYEVHRIIPPRNEPKLKTIRTVVPKNN